MHEFFPESDNPGTDFSDIDCQQMHDIAACTKPLTEHEWHNIYEQHNLFLNSGGKDGSWVTMNVNALIIGIYLGNKETRGEQALLNSKNLTNLNFNRIILTHANLCGAYAPNCDFRESNLSHNLMTDMFLDGATFENATLIECDFSRASLRNCNFKNANLKYADFENCDLTGSNFTGANLKGSHFPGAILNNVIY